MKKAFFIFALLCLSVTAQAQTNPPAGSNLAHVAATSWTNTTGSLTTTGISDPNGGTNAGRLSNGASQASTFPLNALSQTVAVGDVFMAGVWTRINSGSAGTGFPGTISVSGCTATYAATGYSSTLALPAPSSTSSWTWTSVAVKVITVSGNPCSLSLSLVSAASAATDFYAPVFFYIPIGTMQDNQILTQSQALQNYSLTCTTPATAAPPSGCVPSASGTVSTSSLGGPSGTIFNAVSGYGAVGDGSTDNSTAFANLATAVNAYTQHPSNGQGLTDLPTVYLPPGTYNYASGLNFTIPMIFRCEQGAVLNYTGSAHAMDWGPTNLTGSTYQTTYYEIGCTFKGGGSMTEGIYVNDGVLYPRIWDSRFLNFGNSTSTVWQIYFNAASVGIDDPEVARNVFFIDDNTARNGVAVASGSSVATNQLRFHDNVMVCAQVPGTTNSNGTHSCSTSATGVLSDGTGSMIKNNSIVWFQPNIQLGSHSFATVIDTLITETNSSSSSISSPAISFGDSTGGNNPSANISGVTVANVSANTHNTDSPTTSPIIGPTTTSALISGWNLSHFRGTEISATIPTVVMNNTTGQTGNSYFDVQSAVSGTSFSPTVLIETAGTNLNDPFKGLTGEGSAGGNPTYGLACAASGVTSQGCLFRIQNHSAGGNPYVRLVLDTADDSQTYSGRGGFVQHTSNAGGGTKIGDWEGLPVQILTNNTGGAGNIALHTVFLPQGGIADEGATFTASGCSISAHKGGAAAGQYTSGTSGTCTVSITPGSTAPNGWVCDAHDLTTPADVQNQTSASTATVPVISGTTVSGDVVNFKCYAY